jgi:acetoin utilization deacetylase AcuC-like enzyme
MKLTLKFYGIIITHNEINLFNCYFCSMLKIAWSENFAHPLPPGHRFPMIKYELLPEQLIYEGTISSVNLFDPGLIEEKNIILTHSASYWQKLKNLQLNASEIRRTGFPLSDALVRREQTIMQGTLQLFMH